MATLTELTAKTIADCIPNDTDEVYVCGGGAHNTFLMERLHINTGKDVNSTTAIGINPDYVEAVTFAWLAYRRINNLPGNSVPSTGARAERVLGAIYQ
jgi:anhydro-N-acetylmuramic acid kinase